MVLRFTGIARTRGTVRFNTSILRNARWRVLPPAVAGATLHVRYHAALSPSFRPLDALTKRNGLRPTFPDGGATARRARARLRARRQTWLFQHVALINIGISWTDGSLGLTPRLPHLPNANDRWLLA